MPPSHLSRSSKPLCGRYLSFAEREEIARLRAQGHGVREMARRLGRAPSTISRELRRHAATRRGGLEYRATTAQWHAERAARRPKAAKLATNTALRADVQERLAGHVAAPGGAAVPGPAVPWKGRRHGPRQNRRWGMAWSPQPIAERLRLDHPDDTAMRISHEAIDQALYVQGRGALRRELTACLRTGRALRVPRARTRGQGRPGQVLRHSGGDDQPAPGGGRGPRGSGALGGGSHPWAPEFGDRHPRRAHDPAHDAAAPPADDGPRRTGRARRTGQPSPGTAPRRSATRSRARSRRCPSSCGSR